METIMKNQFEIILKELSDIKSELNELKRICSTKEAPIEDQNLSITELAEYLKVSKPTIHSYKNQGLFPFYQAGRTVYFKKSEVDAAFANKNLNLKFQ